LGGCEDISDQSDERPLHQNPGHGLEPIVHMVDCISMGRVCHGLGQRRRSICICTSFSDELHRGEMLQ
jgi:hypothetical protein